MASTHGNLVLPPSRPVAEGGTEDHRSRRAIAPPIASRLSESAFASGPPKVSSPRCSPDAYEETTTMTILHPDITTKEQLLNALDKVDGIQNIRTFEDVINGDQITSYIRCCGEISSNRHSV